MQAQYEHSPPTSSRSTIAAVSPPRTTRSATFSPTGPAPMMTTSYVVSLMSISLRRTAETDRGDEEEEGARNGVADRVGQGRVVGGGAGDERPAGEHGDGATDDHRPLPAQAAARNGHRQLDQTRHDRPGAPHPQDRRDTGRAGDRQTGRGEQADHDVHVEQGR